MSTLGLESIFVGYVLQKNWGAIGSGVLEGPLYFFSFSFRAGILQLSLLLRRNPVSSLVLRGVAAVEVDFLLLLEDGGVFLRGAALR